MWHLQTEFRKSKLLHSDVGMDLSTLNLQGEFRKFLFGCLEVVVAPSNWISKIEIAPMIMTFSTSNLQAELWKFPFCISPWFFHFPFASHRYVRWFQHVRTEQNVRFHANSVLCPCKLCAVHANVDVYPRFVLKTFHCSLSTFRSTHCTLYTLELQLELQPHRI